GDEEGTRDLVGLEAAQRAQRQDDLCVERERRMAAGEDQLEPLVCELRVVAVRFHRLLDLQELRLRGERLLAPAAIDGSVARRRREPGAGVVRRTVSPPAVRGDRERLLSGLLGKIEVTEEADQVGKDPTPLIAKDVAELLQRSTNGRTSTTPPMRAAGTF